MDRQAAVERARALSRVGSTRPGDPDRERDVDGGRRELAQGPDQPAAFGRGLEDRGALDRQRTDPARDDVGQGHALERDAAAARLLARWWRRDGDDGRREGRGRKPRQPIPKEDIGGWIEECLQARRSEIGASRLDPGQSDLVTSHRDHDAICGHVVGIGRGGGHELREQPVRTGQRQPPDPQRPAVRSQRDALDREGSGPAVDLDPARRQAGKGADGCRDRPHPESLRDAVRQDVPGAREQGEAGGGGRDQSQASHDVSPRAGRPAPVERRETG